MRVETGIIDPNESLCDLPSGVASELVKCLQVHNRWKLLLESLENVNSTYQFSVGEVNLNEQLGNEAAAKVLWQLGMRGMTISELTFILERLKWEQELRLLKAPEPVKIQVHPPSRLRAKVGEAIKLTCYAVGFPYPRYEWLVCHANDVNVREVQHPTQINSELVIARVTFQDAGKYVCRVRNDYSYQDSEWCKLTVEPGDQIPDPEEDLPDNTIPDPEMVRPRKELAIGLPIHAGADVNNVHEQMHGLRLHTEEYGPSITVHPSKTPIHVPVGQPATMFVEADANPPPSYRWFRKHRDRGTIHPVDEVHCQGRVLRILEAKETHNGDYYCEVSNHICTTKSDSCQLYVYSPQLPDNPKIIFEPQSQTRNIDDKVLLEVIAKGKGHLTYQWFKDGYEVPGETSHRYEFRILSSKDAGSFQCLVSCPETRGIAMTNSNKPCRLDVRLPLSKDVVKYRAKDKVALVIGTSAYEIYDRVLIASKYDAREMSSILTELGFSVISLLDPSREEILQSIDMFCKMLETPSDKGTAHHTGMYGVFYWAGHGCYHLGDSYLIPYHVGAPAKLDDCISVEYIRSKMLSMDPSLCLLLLDMCRLEAEGAMELPRDYKAHQAGKKVGGRHDYNNVPYGNHCTIYATSIDQEAFEVKREKCSIFMQCFKKAVRKETKNLSELYDVLLDALKKRDGADRKQNPEKVSNLKQNRTLHDEIESSGHTEIVEWRREQWQNTHSLPKDRYVDFNDVGISIAVLFEQFLSNVMIMRVKVLRLGSATEINKIETDHNPQKVNIVNCSAEYPGAEPETWYFQVWALQRLVTDLHVTIRLQYTVFNGRIGETQRRLNLERPLIAGSFLWNDRDTAEDGGRGEEEMGAAGGGYVNNVHEMQHLPHMPAQPAAFNIDHLYAQPTYGNVLPHNQPATGYPLGMLYQQQSHDQQIALASGHKICHPVQEDQPGLYHQALPHQQYQGYQ